MGSRGSKTEFYHDDILMKDKIPELCEKDDDDDDDNCMSCIPGTP
jgi:hypothetical protein